MPLSWSAKGHWPPLCVHLSVCLASSTSPSHPYLCLQMAVSGSLSLFPILMRPIPDPILHPPRDPYTGAHALSGSQSVVQDTLGSLQDPFRMSRRSKLFAYNTKKLLAFFTLCLSQELQWSFPEATGHVTLQQTKCRSSHKQLSPIEPDTEEICQKYNSATPLTKCFEI